MRRSSATPSTLQEWRRAQQDYKDPTKRKAAAAKKAEAEAWERNVRRSGGLEVLRRDVPSDSWTFYVNTCWSLWFCKQGDQHLLFGPGVSDALVALE